MFVDEPPDVVIIEQAPVPEPVHEIFTLEDSYEQVKINFEPVGWLP